MSVSLYRKYRPARFEDVIGQAHVARTLMNAINQDRVSHAYLFAGPRGTGKTSTAKILAMALYREVIALSGLFHVPRGSLAGAGCPGGAQRFAFDGVGARSLY